MCQLVWHPSCRQACVHVETQPPAQELLLVWRSRSVVSCTVGRAEQAGQCDTKDLSAVCGYLLVHKPYRGFLVPKSPNIGQELSWGTWQWLRVAVGWGWRVSTSSLCLACPCPHGPVGVSNKKWFAACHMAQAPEAPRRVMGSTIQMSEAEAPFGSAVLQRTCSSCHHVWTAGVRKPYT